MSKAVLVFGVCILSMSAQAVHANEISVGVSYATWNYQELFSPDYSPSSLELVASYRLHPNLDIQGNLGLGLSEDNKNSGLLNIGVKVENYAGIYLKPNYDFGNHSLYALLGYATTSIERTFLNLAYDESMSGLSYGVGASFGIDDTSSITAEWRQQFDDNRFDLSGFVVGYSHTF